MYDYLPCITVCHVPALHSFLQHYDGAVALLISWRQRCANTGICYFRGLLHPRHHFFKLHLRGKGERAHVVAAFTILRFILVLQFWDTPRSESDVIQTLNKVDLHLRQLRRLRPGAWLDDEVLIKNTTLHFNYNDAVFFGSSQG